MEIQIQITTPDRKTADTIANHLIEKQLAACVQIIGPMTSNYRWKDKVESDTEWLCLIKTVKEKYDTIEKTIVEIHPYETPQIIALEIKVGFAPYLDWLRKETNTSDTKS